MEQKQEEFQNCTTGLGAITYPASDILALVTIGLTESYSSITHSLIGDGVCSGSPADFIVDGSAYAVNSSEYTTALLLSNVASSIPAFSGAYHTYNPANDYAYYDLSSDEITATETKLQYRFALPSLTGYTCYRITWSEKFVPESGSTVYTSLSYTWDGSATYAGPYTIDPPASQGTTTVVSVVVTCSGC